MINRTTAIQEDDFILFEEQKPCSRDEKRAYVLSVGNNEIGLLDLVLLDAIADSDGYHR